MNNAVNRFDDNGNWSLPNWVKVTIGVVVIAGLAAATVCTGGASAVIYKALKTMGLNGTSRLDVIGIAKNGVNKLVEVVSPKQSTNYIVNKMSNMLSNNAGAIGKTITWGRNLFK